MRWRGEDAERPRRQILEPLALVHARGVIHTDIKPENGASPTPPPRMVFDVRHI